MKQMMKALWILALLMPVAAYAQPRIHAGISFSDGRNGNSFYLELTDHYGVPYDQVCYVRDAGIPEDEISDVLYLYTHSHYPLRTIVNLRMRGASWPQLYTRCGIPQDVYYRSNEEIYRHGPPHGYAYGYYKNHGIAYGNTHKNPWTRENMRNWSNDRERFQGRDKSDMRGNGHGRQRGWKNN